MPRPKYLARCSLTLIKTVSNFNNNSKLTRREKKNTTYELTRKVTWVQSSTGGGGGEGTLRVVRSRSKGEEESKKTLKGEEGER